MKRQDIILSAVPVLLLVAFAVNYGLSACKKTSYQPRARQEMTVFLSRIEIGNSRSQVQQVCKTGNYTTPKLQETEQNKLWSVTTPFGIGAGNWILYIEFDEDKVVALRLRTTDSMYDRPREIAPEDKVSQSWHKPFPHGSGI